jgi:ABC-2 type transport system permease protein
MWASFEIPWTILTLNVRERLAYRADFAFATLVRFLPLVTQVFLWGAIFRVGTGNEAGRIQGYAYGDMIAYFLLANVGRAFSSMPGLAGSLAREVRDGSVKRFLTQPVDLLDFYFWARVAHKLVYYVVAVGPFALVFFLCRGFFGPPPDAWTIAAFFCALPLAFLIGFFIECLIGLFAFWFLEVNSLIFIFMMLNYFLSGHMIPLDFLGSVLPDWAMWIVTRLPFQYLSYYPAAVWLGRFTHEELAWHTAAAAMWSVALWLASRWALAHGLRRYSAYGG